MSARIGGPKQLPGAVSRTGQPEPKGWYRLSPTVDGNRLNPVLQTQLLKLQEF